MVRIKGEGEDEKDGGGRRGEGLKKVGGMRAFFYASSSCVELR